MGVGVFEKVVGALIVTPTDSREPKEVVNPHKHSVSRNFREKRGIKKYGVL